MPRCAFKEGCYVKLKSMTPTNYDLMIEALGKGPYRVIKSEIYENSWLLTIETEYRDTRKLWANLCVIVDKS